MVRLLLDRGAYAKGESAMRAALCNPAVLVVLLGHGADPNRPAAYFRPAAARARGASSGCTTRTWS